MIQGSSRRSSIGSRNSVAGIVGRRSRLSRSFGAGAAEIPVASDGIIKVPVVGYEVKEETGRFTVFKLHVTNENMSDSWLVFRRYTDFERLAAKLKEEFPQLPVISLPPKRWLKNNFETTFLEDRMKGIQAFVDSILIQHRLASHGTVRSFFCLDEPPVYTENAEESRAIFGNLEDVMQLKEDLNDRDKEINLLKQEIEILRFRNETLVNLVSQKLCRSCNTRLSSNTINSPSYITGAPPIPVLSSTPNGRSRKKSSGCEMSSMPTTPKGRLACKSLERSAFSIESLPEYKISPVVNVSKTPGKTNGDFPTGADSSTNGNNNGMDHYYSASSTPTLNSNETFSPFEIVSSVVIKQSEENDQNSSFEVLTPTCPNSESPKDTNHNRISSTAQDAIRVSLEQSQQ